MKTTIYNGFTIPLQWWRFWQPPGANLPPVLVRQPDGTYQSVIALEIGTVEEQAQSWDCTFKGLETSDYVVGQVWGRVASRFLILDQVRDKMDFPATVKAVRQLSASWTGCAAKLIEDKANGSAVIQMLQHEIRGILPVNPEGGKVARAAAVSPFIEAGNVYLPHPQLMPWVNDFIEECAAFLSSSRPRIRMFFTRRLSTSGEPPMTARVGSRSVPIST
jgi:predicted phage terminase large subunit-like protein